MAIISVSGRIGSGKDTVGKIIQLITDNPHFTDKAIEEWLERACLNPSWEIKKWADKLKDIVCLLIGCTREQLEDHEFKEKELSEEWWYYKDTIDGGIYNYSTNKEKGFSPYFLLIKPTPRLLLQLLGTECGRNIIHPNIWVNALMSEYNSAWRALDIVNMTDKSVTRVGETPESNWIITDTRFPNELQAVKDRGGISIKVERYPDIKIQKSSKPDDFEIVKFDINNPIHVQHWKGECQLQHESETALDHAEFDETIINDGSKLDLIVKVREILVRRRIINN